MSEEVLESWMTPIGPEVPWLGLLGAGVLGALGSSWRYRLEGQGHEREARSVSGRVIYAIWHGGLLPAVFAYRGRGICTLVSRHRDGEILAHALERLGFAVRRGSSKRRGAAAFLKLLSESGRRDLALTPDGPRGPSGRVAPGVLHLAQRTGLPIVPLGCAAGSAWRLRTWDRMILPHPFSRVVVRAGPALRIPTGAGAGELAEAGSCLARALDELSRPIAPGPDRA